MYIELTPRYNNSWDGPGDSNPQLFPQLVKDSKKTLLAQRRSEEVENNHLPLVVQEKERDIQADKHYKVVQNRSNDSEPLKKLPPTQVETTTLSENIMRNVSKQEKRVIPTKHSSIKRRKSVPRELNHFKSRSNDAHVPKRRSEDVSAHVKVVHSNSIDHKAVKTTPRNLKTPTMNVSRHRAKATNNVSRWPSGRMVELERKNILKEMMHYRVEQKNSCMFEFPAFPYLLPT